MKTLLIVFHSLSGGTRQMAEAAYLGARSEAGVRVRLLPASHATSADVLSADDYIFAQERIGHSTIAVTMDIHSHVTEQMHGDAAAKIGAAYENAKYASTIEH